MQRISHLRWPTRNPMGDVMHYKFKVVQGSTLAFLSGASSGVVGAIQFNSLPSIITNFGNTPGMTILSTAFGIYRIRAIKHKLTFWPLGPNVAPIVGFFQASSDNVFTSPSIGGTCEERWSKYRVLNFPGQGANPSTLSAYYNVRKVYGPVSTMDDSQFASSTLPASPYGNTPAIGPWYRYGIFTLSGANAGTDVSCVVKNEVTVYIRYDAKFEINQ